MTKTYRVNEVFYSLQGEGVRAGTANVFVRFTGCNLRCAVEPGPLSPGGFDCDTEFTSGRGITLIEMAMWCQAAVDMARGPVASGEDGLRSSATWKEPWLILTGGEPGLQVDQELIDFWHQRGCKLAIETNGTVYVSDDKPDGIDWVTLSPKVAEHAIKQPWANEIKYVRAYGQGVPKTDVKADHYLISPAFAGNETDRKTLDWCIKLCQEHPQWRLSLQQHKAWQVR